MASKLQERQKKILSCLIKEYINLCKPISSEWLDKKFNFEVSPATIRRDFAKLTTEGFIERPYISSGRVPTDKGYRFYVDHLVSVSTYWERKGKEIVEDLEREFSNFYLFLEKLAEITAEISSLLTLTKLSEDEFSFQEGWHKVLKEPEFKETSITEGFAEFSQHLEERFEKEELGLQKGLKVEIGKEIGLSQAKNFSLILLRFDFDEREVLMALAGPKRMRYSKVISYLKGILNYGRAKKEKRRKRD